MEIACNMRQRVGREMGNTYGTRMMVVEYKVSTRMETDMEGGDSITRME